MRTIVVTGATEGLGLAAAKQLARADCAVVVHGRSAQKVERVVRQLGPAAKPAVADLSDLDDVRELGRTLASTYPRLDGLLNNAGSFDGDYTGERLLTKQNNEYTLAVNVLAPFLLTSLLLPSLRASGAGRCVISSSVSMGAADALDDLQLEQGYSGHRAYSLSKLADAMLSQELHHRYGSAPTLVFNTMDPTEQVGLGADTKMLRAGWGSWGAAPDEATISADMMAARQWGVVSGHGFARHPKVSDVSARVRLWDECVRLTGAEWPEPEPRGE